MKLRDIADMETYLAERCYCPGEIYDHTGIFFQVFQPDDECTLLINGKYINDDVTAVICKDQILYFFIENGKIAYAERIDATENNAKEIVAVLSGEKQKMIIDEFEEGATEKSLKEVIKLADFMMIGGK